MKRFGFVFLLLCCLYLAFACSAPTEPPLVGEYIVLSMETNEYSTDWEPGPLGGNERNAMYLWIKDDGTFDLANIRSSGPLDNEFLSGKYSGQYKVDKNILQMSLPQGIDVQFYFVDSDSLLTLTDLQFMNHSEDVVPKDYLENLEGARFVLGRQENSFFDRLPEWLVKNYVGSYVRAHPNDFCGDNWPRWHRGGPQIKAIEYGLFNEEGQYWPIRVRVVFDFECMKKNARERVLEQKLFEKTYDWNFYRTVDDGGAVSWVQR